MKFKTHLPIGPPLLALANQNPSVWTDVRFTACSPHMFHLRCKYADLVDNLSPKKVVEPKTSFFARLLYLIKLKGCEMCHRSYLQLDEFDPTKVSTLPD